MELAREAANTAHDSETIYKPYVDYVTHFYFLNEIRETPILLRALGWVTRASQDEHVARCINQCMATIHPAPQNHCDVPNARALLFWCIAATASKAYYGLANLRPHLALKTPISNSSADTSSSITHTRRLLGLAADRVYGDPPQYMYRLGPEFAPENTEQTFHCDDLILRYLAAELREAVARLSDSNRWVRDDIRLRRIFEMVAIMFHTLRHDPDTSPFGTEWYLDGLR